MKIQDELRSSREVAAEKDKKRKAQEEIGTSLRELTKLKEATQEAEERVENDNKKGVAQIQKSVERDQKLRLKSRAEGNAKMVHELKGEGDRKKRRKAYHAAAFQQLKK